VKRYRVSRLVQRLDIIKLYNYSTVE